MVVVVVVVVVLALLREQNCTSFNGTFSLSLPIVVFIMRLRSPSRPLGTPSSFSRNRARFLSLFWRRIFFLLAYPEDFLRRAMRFCYINIGSISKRTPFYQPSPRFSLFFCEERREGWWLHDARDLRKLKRRGVSRIRWKLFSVDNVIRNRAGATLGYIRVRMSDMSDVPEKL